MKTSNIAAWFIVGSLSVAGCDEPETADNVLPTEESYRCNMDIVPGLNTMTCDGIEFNVEMPGSCIGGSCGLIVDLHGHGMDADQYEEDSQVRRIGTERGYIVVQPTAPTRVLDTPYWNSQADDAVVAFVDTALQYWPVDPERVHVAGHDVGGWMAWRLVCEHADLFASAATLGAGDSECPEVFNPKSCDFAEEGPSREIDLLVVHGSNDPIVDLSCAQSQVDAVVDAWAMAPFSSSQDTDSGYVRTRYANAKGTTLQFVTHEYETDYENQYLGEYLGHCVPGGHGALACTGEGQYTWGSAVLDFFDGAR